MGSTTNFSMPIVIANTGMDCGAINLRESRVPPDKLAEFARSPNHHVRVATLASVTADGGVRDAR